MARTIAEQTFHIKLAHMGMCRAMPASREPGSVIDTTLPPATALNWRVKAMVLALPPLFERASIAEPGRTMPRSPCSASTGWTNAA